MTIQTSRSYHCPKCGHPQEFTLWQSLNVTLNPELKERLFHGQINVFTCDSCNFASFIDYPLLYHDMDRTFCIQYYPVAALEDEDFFKIFRKNGTLNLNMPSGHYLENPHLVFDMHEMLRYIIFRERIFEVGQD
jgi:hypothetical protein